MAKTTRNQMRTSPIYCLFLHSVFLYQKVPLTYFKQILSLLDMSPKNDAEIQRLFRLFQNGTKLPKEFRLETTSFYFKQNGIKGDFFKLLEYDVQLLLKKSKQLQASIRNLTNLYLQNDRNK